MATPINIEEARQKLESEHAEVMESLGDVWVKVEAIKASKPTDNVHDLLKDLEDAVKEARDGGVIGSGSNDHRRALKKYLELTAPPP